MNRPYMLEPVEEILETALLTASVRDAIPVSLILVGDSGVAKSKLLMRLNGNGIHMTDSFSSQGLFDLVQRDNKNEMKFIVTPDLNSTLSRKQSTVNLTVANLLSVTADGTCRIDDGRQEKIAKHSPVGLITACTPQIYQQQAKKWFALGLRRRIIPIFYAYTAETVSRLMAMVRDNKISAASFPHVSVVFPPPILPAINQSVAKDLEIHAVKFAQNLGKLSFHDTQKIKRWTIANVIPISPLVTLQALARAHAIRGKRGQVTQEDVDFIARFLSFTDAETPKQI